MSDQPPTGPDLTKRPDSDPWAVPSTSSSSPSYPPPPAYTPPEQLLGYPGYGPPPGTQPPPALDPNDPYRFGPPAGQPATRSYAAPPPYPTSPYPAQPGYPTQPYGPPGGPQPYYGSGFPQAAPENGKALAGMILGIVGLVLCWIPFFGAVVPILGIIFSALGFGAAKRGQGRQGMALAGLILSALAIVLNVLITVLILANTHTHRECSSYYDGSGNYHYSCN